MKPVCRIASHRLHKQYKNPSQDKKCQTPKRISINNSNYIFQCPQGLQQHHKSYFDQHSKLTQVYHQQKQVTLFLARTLTLPVCERATKGGIPPSLTSKPRFLMLSAHRCKSVKTANSFPLTEPSSMASTRAGIPPSSTMASLPSSIAAKLLSTTIAFSAMPVPCSATSPTSGFTAPAVTARSLFCFNEQSL